MRLKILIAPMHGLPFRDLYVDVSLYCLMRPWLTFENPYVSLIGPHSKVWNNQGNGYMHPSPHSSLPYTMDRRVSFLDPVQCLLVGEKNCSKPWHGPNFNILPPTKDPFVFVHCTLWDFSISCPSP